MLRRLILALLAAVLTGCGGGGEDEPPPVEFDYPETTALLWRETSLDVRASGLEKRTPRCSIVDGALQPGLVLHADSCRVDGVPLEVGVRKLRVQMSYSNDHGFEGFVERDVSFEVVGPSLLYDLAIDGVRGTAFSILPHSTAELEWTPAAGESLTYALQTGSRLPTGMTLDPATGRLHGILNQAGVKKFFLEVTATGPLGRYKDAEHLVFTTPAEGLNVVMGDGAPVVATEGSVLDLSPTFDFHGLDSSAYTIGPYRLPDDSELPRGTSFDPVTGRLSGKLLDIDSYEFRFEVQISVGGETVFYRGSLLEVQVTSASAP